MVDRHGLKTSGHPRAAVLEKRELNWDVTPDVKQEFFQFLEFRLHKHSKKSVMKKRCGTVLFNCSIMKSCVKRLGLNIFR